ncbi:PREDICTED: calmodulin-like protein 1 [Tarenaya hassleriana]|uniref:calmodulin-like protein 1 n=1 Tax=Tarenaya hassleriana TaxID=28532 RepID=UPI00053C7638|nr:PREDICTED: calmodulin-like protein 1 [Tarenaya hassleriana]
MSNVSFLELQYKISKNRFLRKPSRMFSRQTSGLSASPASVSQPDINEMRRVFNRFDSDKDGRISQREYKAVLRALGQDKAVEEVPKIFKAVDMDRDGFIDFKEFMEVHKAGGGVRTSDIRNAFWTFDLNGDGKISAEEVMSVLRRLGERCSLEDCRRMVRAVDADGDGLVNMDEFMTMMTTTQSMTIIV